MGGCLLLETSRELDAERPGFGGPWANPILAVDDEDEFDPDFYNDDEEDDSEEDADFMEDDDESLDDEPLSDDDDEDL